MFDGVKLEDVLGSLPKKKTTQEDQEAVVHDELVC
jgi:hypothetical protein